VDNGLVHNSICGILEDETNGDIWVAALNGISKINLQSGKITNYTRKTGFPLEEVSRKAFLKGSDGLFYIGGSNGLASFDPTIFRDVFSKPPVVRISLVKSLNPENDLQQSGFDNYVALNNIEFPYDHSSIIIKFSALNYFYPRGSQYAYKLEGSDLDWKYTEQNEAIYSNLSGGKYTFYVKARNNDGIWSEDITAVNIVIHPPFWLSIWAKITYVLIITGLFYFIVQFFYNKKTAKYRQQIDRIEKENIEKYYQMKLELFTKFSHELRTPLTLIIGPTEDLLNARSIPDKLLYPVRLIHKNANRLLLLVNQLMDFRKMEHGAMRLNVQQVEIDSFLLEQIESFSELARKKNIKLSYLNQYWEKDIWFDSELMEKVIFNLLSNAVKHTHKGGEIIVSSKREEDHLIISVKDTGEGIAQENLEKIFNPFFQVEQGNRSNMFGSGIGLNLAKYVVTLHGGKIWVESAVGKGSEFFVLLFLGVEHYDETSTKIVTETNNDDQSRLLEKNSMLTIETGNKIEEAETKNKTLLLVAEDDDDLRHYIISNLSDEYAIIEAADGKEALAKSLEKLPDLKNDD
jgi:signal transduction histidine kinase